MLKIFTVTLNHTKFDTSINNLYLIDENIIPKIKNKMNYCFSNHKYKFPTLEITEKEIISKCKRQTFYPNYPRHIDSFNIQYHKSSQQIYQKRFLLTSNNEETTTTARV